MEKEISKGIVVEALLPSEPLIGPMPCNQSKNETLKEIAKEINYKIRKS